MILAVFYDTASMEIKSSGIYTNPEHIPEPEVGQGLATVDSPSESLMANPLQVMDDGEGGVTVQAQADQRPFCELVLGVDDGSGFVSRWDPEYKAFLFQVGEGIHVQGVLAMDQGLTQKVPGTIEFRTPIDRNGIPDRVVLLAFDNGDAARTLALDTSGVYLITQEHAYKVRLLDPDGNQVDQVKTIVAE